MKKSIVLAALFLLCSAALHANGIRFLKVTSWKAVLQQAKKEKKLIFLDAYAVWCGPCKYLQQNVFTDNAVGALYNKQFINVKIDMEKGEGIALAEQLGISSYPTLFFINGEGEVVHKYIGALRSAEFLALGQAALDPDKQFYTLRKKAVAGHPAPRAVHDWFHQAEELDEPDRHEVLESYLAKTTHPFVEKEMLELVLDHALELTEKQLDELHAAKGEALRLTGKTEKEFTESFLKKLIPLAYTASMETGELDLDGYRKRIGRYLPAKAELEAQKMKARYAFWEDDHKRCLDEFAVLLKTPSLQLPGRDLAQQLLDYAVVIDAQGRTAEFLPLITGYSLPSDEQDEAFYKHFALLCLYAEAGDERGKKESYGKVSNDPRTPDFLKNLAQRIYEGER